MVDMVYHAVCGDLDTCQKSVWELKEYAARITPTSDRFTIMTNCSAALARLGDFDGAMDLLEEVFTTASSLNLPLAAAAAIVRATGICCDSQNGTHAKKWIARYSELNEASLQDWHRRNFRLNRAIFALWDGDIGLAETSLNTEGRPYWENSSGSFRSAALAVKIRLECAKRSPIEAITPFVETLKSEYAQQASMGTYDIPAYSLFLGLKYVSSDKTAAYQLLSDYVSQHRRDRWPVNSEIANALLQADH